MYTEYNDITDRIAEPPKWWDEQGVPRYAEFAPNLAANIYAVEVALVEVACSDCGQLFQVSVSFLPAGFEPPYPPHIHSLADAIRGGEICFGDPPNYGNCRAGPSQTVFNLRVLQYWTRRLRGWGEYTRDPSLEIDLPELHTLPEWLQARIHY